MKAQWNQDYSPELLIEDLKNSLSLTADGEVSLRGYKLEKYIPVLSSALNLSPEIPDESKKLIMYKSIISAFKLNRFTKEGLLAEIKKLEGEYLKRKIGKYVLVSEIALKASGAYPRYKLNDCTICIGNLPRKFAVRRKEFLKWGRYHIHGKLPELYTPVRIMTSGRSDVEAGDKALKSINLLRALWNLSLNISKGLRISSGKRKPVNKITLGPLHSLHYRDGKNVGGPFWFNPLYISPVEVTQPSNNWNKVLKDEALLRRRVSKSPFKEIIENSLLRYNDALDEIDFQVAFLKLWSLMEFLTFTTNEPYKVTIKRTAFIFNNPEIHKEILNHLRESRNKIVHHNKGDNNEELLEYQTKYYVEKLLLFYIFQGNKFKTKEEITNLLDLPLDKGLLKMRKKTIDIGIRYRNKEKI